MKVSVVIPVYNAEEFLRSSVESALAQPETGEVLLIEDCSKDGSLQICQKLASEYQKVKFFHHSLSKNCGAGASRNLGVRNARYDLIAFLDADDFFLPSRFAASCQILSSNPNVEGTFEAVGTHFANEDVKQAWLASGRALLTAFRDKVDPECLFEAQGPIGHKGYAHIDGWVVKKSVFEKTGLFDENLRFHQDTAMAVKLSAMCRIAVGDIAQPVAMRRVHAGNRITAKRSSARIFRERVLMWRVLWRWGKKNLQGSRRELLLRKYLEYASQPFTGIDHELKRISIVPFCQLIYVLFRDMSLVGENTYRQQVTQCVDNFKDYVGWPKSWGG